MTLACLYGSGTLAAEVRKKIPSSVHGIDIRLDRTADATEYPNRPLHKLDGLHVAKIENLLLTNNIKEVIVCGRPALHTINFDQSVMNGPNAIDQYAHDIFNYIEKRYLLKNGIKLTGVENFVDVTPGKGACVSSTHFPNQKLFNSQVYAAFGNVKLFKAAHAAIALNENIIIKEDENGTDQMILDYIKNTDRAFMRQNPTIFYKFPLKSCNPYFDIPVIGPRTVELLSKANVIGIVVHHTYCYIDKKQTTLNSCRDKNIFLLGVDI